MDSTNAVAIYVRVSSEEQVNGYSLDAQEAVLSEDVKKRGKWVYQVYKDAGVSGAKEDRQGLKRLMIDAHRSCFGEVLVWKVSRFSRRLHHLLSIIEELKELEIFFLSYSEHFDTNTVMGNFSLTMLGAVSQMQRESWKESSWIGMKKRTASGRWNGGTVLGYRSVHDPDDPRGGTKLEIVLEEAEIVEEIFRLYDEGLGYKAIVNRLNAKGAMTKNGNLFALINIKIILENPVYIGQVRLAGEIVQGIHEPIIPQALWDKVQERKKLKSHRAEKKIDREYLLSGLLRCPECDGPMIPSHCKRVRKNGLIRMDYRYICARYLGKGSSACHGNVVNAEVVDPEVAEYIMNYLSDPYWADKVVESILQKRSKTEMSYSECNEKLEEISRRGRDLLLLFENDKIDLKDFKAKGDKLKQARAVLITQAETVERMQAVPRWTETQIRAAIDSIREVYRQATTAQKRDLIRKLVKRITLNHQRQIEHIELLPLPMNDDMNN